jgi:hypothetical protein
MAWTQAQIDALKTAIAMGQRSVRHGETSVEYRSIEEMQQVLAMMQADVTTRTRSTVACYRSFR